MRIAYFCRMRQLLPLSLLLAIMAMLTSCVTDDYGYGNPGGSYVPTVYIPNDLGDYERRFVHAVEDSLSSAGYRVTRSRSAEYELEFRIEAGPLNTDTYLTLYRNGNETVTAYARGSGIFRGDAVVRESFDKCLYEFERQLPSATSYGRGRGYDRGSDTYDSYGPGRSRYDRDRYDHNNRGDDYYRGY